MNTGVCHCPYENVWMYVILYNNVQSIIPLQVEMLPVQLLIKKYIHKYTVTTYNNIYTVHKQTSSC